MRGRRRSSRRATSRSIDDAISTTGGSFTSGSATKSVGAGPQGLSAARPVFGLGRTVQRKETEPGDVAQRKDAEEEEAAASEEQVEETAPEMEEEVSTSLQRQEEDLEEEESSAPTRKKARDGGGERGSDSSDGGGGLGTLKGRGQPLPSSSQSFFGSRMGHDFGQVRIHTDAHAANLSARLNARAFTTGRHIAFGHGEYRPGSIDGDTLIAHELAHVAQQGNAPNVVEGRAGGNALEKDADQSAAGAVAGRWTEMTGSISNAARSAAPRLKSGLRLQRCAKYSKAEKQKIEDTKKILNSSATGIEALEIQKKYKVEFAFGAAGTGSYFDPSSNTMRMDSGHPPERAALTFVHEMNHAEAHHLGLQADPTKETRDDYIKKMVTEEAEGVVKSIEAKTELKGKADFSKIGGYPPLEGEYKKAHDDAIKAAKAADPKKSEAELSAIGRAAGRKRVIKGFMDGEITTSTTKETYPDYYGKAWDKRNTGSK